jgi:hypothetical protein
MQSEIEDDWCFVYGLIKTLKDYNSLKLIIKASYVVINYLHYYLI